MLILRADGLSTARAITGTLLTFRAPHYTCSGVALAAELGYAKDGALYLDEAAEFKREAVEMLAQSIETAHRLPRAIIVDVRNPFLPGGREPNERAAERYRDRYNWVAWRLEQAVWRAENKDAAPLEVLS